MARENDCRERYEAGERRCCWPVVLLVLAMVAWVSGCAGVVNGQNPGGNTPPAIAISGVTSAGITSTSGAVSWNTNVAGTSQVEYGASASYGQSTFLIPR